MYKRQILNVQVQIVIGNAVIEVYNELMKLCKPQEQQSIKTEKQSFGNTLLSFIVGIFQPLVPAIAGAVSYTHLDVYKRQF